MYSFTYFIFRSICPLAALGVALAVGVLGGVLA